MNAFPELPTLTREAPSSPTPAPHMPEPGTSAVKRRWMWVPVRSLTSRHRDRIRAHLLALDEHDRYLRFGFVASDAQVGHYADSIDFDRDEVFGIFNRRLALIAMAHLAYAPVPQIVGRAAMAEFGVSVGRSSRGRGLGARLFDHAILHARNRGIETLFVHALSENTAMLRIARNAGAKVDREGSESECWLTLPADDLMSQMGAIVEEHAAEWDYRIKAHAQRMQQLIEAKPEVKTGVSGSGRDGSP